MTYAQAAQRAIELGGRYDGHEVPTDIHPFTKALGSRACRAGLMGVAKDTYPRDGDTYSFVVGFAEVEVDVETGKTRARRLSGVADVGTVINPRSLHGQILGGIMLGIGHALQQKWVYDPHYGVPLAMRFHHNKPLTILDIPAEMHTLALDIADPETPVGARGVGEPPVGAGYGSVHERDCRCDRRGRVPALAGHRRHRAHVARARPADARCARCTHLTLARLTLPLDDGIVVVEVRKEGRRCQAAECRLRFAPG